MPLTEKGQRVGAIFKLKDGHAELFGYGVYLGDEVPPPDAPGIGQILNEIGQAVPKLRLDDGQELWGFECWWASEGFIVNLVGKSHTTMITVDAARQRAKEQEIT